VIPFPVGFCYTQVATLLQSLGITVIIPPPPRTPELPLESSLVLHSLLTLS
jgi:hypothetical protein